MSAWVVALGLSAGYLINKNVQMRSRLHESMTKSNAAAHPATDGPPTAEIRKVQATVPIADRYQDMNLQDLSTKTAADLVARREAAHQEVAQYEQGLPQIEGVYLSFDRHGV